MAFIMLNSWTAPAPSLGVVLPSGGSVSVVYGCLVSSLGAATTGLSLAELCHVYPVTGGQYDWVYIITPPQYRRAVAYAVGWLAAAGWIALTAVSAAFCGTFISAFVALWHPDFTLTNYHTFLVYIGFCVLPFLLNTFGIALLPVVEKAGFYWGVSGIVVVSVVLLATAGPDFQPPKAVFATFTNETGWPDGVAFLLGLLQSTLGLAGYDAITHMMEEMPAPSVNGPKVLLLAIALGAVTGWLFLVVLLLCLKDIDAVIASPTGPLLAIYQQATNSAAGATCLAMFNFLCMVFMTQGIMTIASRMVWTFARDRGLGHLSPALAPVHPRLKVPVWSVVFVLVWCVVLGLIYLGSTVAFNAIASSSLSLLQISYFIPILIVFVRGDAVFADQPRTWSLGAWRRPINAVALAFLLTTSVFFAFPPALPVSGSSMNYDVVVLAVVALFAAGTWVTDARTRFYGPSELELRVQEGRRTW
ncbi:hypothetical protein VHUM_04054 [Vanrija humicola]|uniref:Amino acid permease/ SLC12A domain-containing protein n=1 Tax=Vanrija humicola TaxID=5417 RepID=A0A7D8Z2K9_VANHU|nr:hypothetical protein VHUM_04054 [Vanrija humicola]